jgi:hypothetical protein
MSIQLDIPTHKFVPIVEMGAQAGAWVHRNYMTK